MVWDGLYFMVDVHFEWTTVKFAQFSLYIFLLSFFSFFCFNACAKVKTYEDPNSRIVLGPHEPIFLRTSGHSKQNT